MKQVLNRVIKEDVLGPEYDIIVTLSGPDNFLIIEQTNEYIYLDKPQAKELISALTDYINYLDLN